MRKESLQLKLLREIANEFDLSIEDLNCYNTQTHSVYGLIKIIEDGCNKFFKKYKIVKRRGK
jgi:hypothetical protein